MAIMTRHELFNELLKKENIKNMPFSDFIEAAKVVLALNDKLEKLYFENKAAKYAKGDKE